MKCQDEGRGKDYPKLDNEYSFSGFPYLHYMAENVEDHVRDKTCEEGYQ
jgi:hypothetical protein